MSALDWTEPCAIESCDRPAPGFVIAAVATLDTNEAVDVELLVCAEHMEALEALEVTQ